MSSPSTLEPGFRLGKYEVLAHVATGGMGEVYKAMDLELRRTVALKVLPTHLARRGPVLERFCREGRYAARLSHQHIVTLFECGYDPDQDLHYLALEFIDGIDLGEYIARKGRLPPEEARRILIQAAEALDHAFRQGIIHRDIKPANFLLARVNNRALVKMTDLGLARVEDDDDFKVTREGSTVGTIDYMAPEQARDSQAADIRSDIYSLGCTAYHMLAGKAPFSEGGLGERVYKHMEVAPPDVRQFSPAVSEGFWAVLLKMMAKQPEDRYATPSELLQELRHTPAEGEAAPTVPLSSGRRKTDHVPAPSAELGARGAEPGTPEAPSPAARTPSSTEVAPPLVTPEQMKAAASFHERAVQVLAEGKGDDYARQLLTSCLKLDPFNPAYRKTLRALNARASRGLFGRWLGPLTVLAAKSRMRSARANGEWRKVLEHGEEVLARQPADVDTHLELAEAAEKLELLSLALWFLEQGRDQVPDNANLMRAMARLQEKRQEWKRAIALWEKVRTLEPNDQEARRKITDLSVKDHLAKSSYRR